jgi:hypothetical protein
MLRWISTGGVIHESRGECSDNAWDGIVVPIQEEWQLMEDMRQFPKGSVDWMEATTQLQELRAFRE